jgi:choline kinase
MTHLVVLAAGMGKRIGGLNGGAPKVMLALPTGRSLLAENLCNALGSGVVSQATVITGHLAEVVGREVAGHVYAGQVRTRHNPEYATAGPTRSLLEVRDVIGSEDVIVINGDTFYRPDAFGRLDDAGDEGLFLAFSRAVQDADDVKVALREDGSVARVGKALSAQDGEGISAGMFLVRGSAARARFADVLDAFAADGRAMTRGVIWHDLVSDLARTEGRVSAVEIDRAWWREVDTAADYEALCASLR